MSDPAKPQPRCSRCGEPMVFSDSIALDVCLWCRPWPDHPLHSDHRRALATEDAHPTNRSESDGE